MDSTQHDARAGNNFVIIRSAIDGSGHITQDMVTDLLARLQRAASQDRSAPPSSMPRVNINSNAAEENDVVVEVQEFVPEEEITVVESGEIIRSKASTAAAASSSHTMSFEVPSASETPPPKEQPESHPELTFSYELQQGYRILRELTSDSNKSFVRPFLNPIDSSSPDYAEYHKRVKRPIWLKQIREKFETGVYKTITEFVADMRLLLENCYRFNGPDHSISRKAQRIETLLEQKLALLSRELREKTSLTATSGKGLAELQHGTRRHKVLVSHDSSALLNELRREAAARDREARRQHMMEKRQSYELFMLSLQSWEDSLLEGQHLSAMWEIPQICHFVLLCAVPLGLSGIPVYELERSFLMPRESSALQRVMTSLLSTPFQRTRLENKPPMPYRVWTAKLSTVVRQWYKALADCGRDLTKACQKSGIEEKFFKVLGMTNALAFRPFHELSVYQRVWIVKSLCDHCVESQQSLSDTIEAQPTNDQRAVVLGVDRHGGYSYIHFPLFCGADLRVYRQKIEEQADSEPECAPVKRSRRSKLKRKRRTQRHEIPVDSHRSRDTRLRQNPRKVHCFQADMEDTSTKSSGSSDSDSDSSSSEDQLPVKKPFLTYRDLDQTASSVCPPLSIASSEGATVLRRSLRKVLEESIKDAVSSSVSNSRESTPPRVSGLGRRISSRQVSSPASSSRPTRLSENNDESLGTRSFRGGISSEMTRVAKQLDFRQRSTRVRKFKCSVDDEATTSVPSGSIVSSDDDTTSVKESSKVCNSVSDLSMITNSSRLASRADTSDTDSRASSLCAYSTRSVSAAKLNNRIRATAKQKSGKRSRQLVKDVADELSKLQSSDSETDGQTVALQTPFFDSFPDNSSNGSSICSSLPAAELTTDRSVENCKNDVHTSSQAKETSAVPLDPDKADLVKSAELETDEENRHGSELQARSPRNVEENVPEIQSNLQNKVTRFQNEKGANDESEDDVSSSSIPKGRSLYENKSALLAVEDNVIETDHEEKDASLKVNHDSLETAKDDMKVEESADDVPRITDQTEDEKAATDACSKTVTDDCSEEQSSSEKFKEEVDNMSNVKEEPPEILGPNIEEFQLVADSIASLRNLVAKIAEGLPAQDETDSTMSQTNHDRVVDTELACELELHDHLSCLLAELEPYEQKLIQLNKKMKIKLRKEHENYVDEPPDKQQAEEAWHSSESGDSDAEDTASLVGNSCSISQPSTPVPSAPDDAFIPGVRSLRRRLVINDNSRTVSSKSRKRPATDMQETAAAKIAKTADESGSTEGSGRHGATTPAVENRQTSATSKQRSVRPATSGGAPPSQRAVLRIAQPDGSVCFLAIDNVSDISRLPVTAVVQQLLANQKLASANHRLSLSASRSAGLVPGFAARALAPMTADGPVLPPAATSLQDISSQSVCSVPASASSPNSITGLSAPLTSFGVGMLPSLSMPSQLAQVPVLRPQNPSQSNSLSAALNRLRSQNALGHLFQNRALNLRGLTGQSVTSQQLLNNMTAIRAAALSSTTPATSSSACRIMPVVTDQSVACPLPAAVTVPLQRSSISVTITSPQPSLLANTQIPNTTLPGYPVNILSSLGNQRLLLLNAGSQEMKRMFASGVTSVAAAPVIGSGNCPGSQPNRTVAGHTFPVSSTTCSSGAIVMSSSAQQITSGNSSASVLPSVAAIPALGIPALGIPGIRRGVKESALALAVRAAVAAGRGPTILNPLNRPQQPRYMNNLTVKTLLENRAISTAESPAPPSAETVTRSSLCATVGLAGSTESKMIVQPSTLSSGAFSSSSIPTQTALPQTSTVGRTSGASLASLQLSTQQLSGQPVLALLPAGVNIGTARVQQFVAISAAAVSIAKPATTLVSVAPLGFISQAVARPLLVSRNLDVGALRAMIPQSKSRAPPSRPARNNTRTTSVMKAPIPALPRLTDLGLASSSADQTAVASSAVLAATVSPVSVVATPIATVAQNQSPSISVCSVSTHPGTYTAVSSVPQPAVTLVRRGNKSVVVSAGTSSLVVPPSNSPSQVFLLQSADGSLVQLVQLPAVAAVNQSVTNRPSLLSQQVVLAPHPAVSGTSLQLYAMSSASAANLSKMSASVPVVQFVMCSSACSASSSMTALRGTNSAASPASVLPVCASALSPVQQTAAASSQHLTTSPHSLLDTNRLSVSNTADRSKPTIQQSQHSTELPKNSGLAEAADLFLMAASVVDRADKDVDRISTASTRTVTSSSSSLLTLTTR